MPVGSETIICGQYTLTLGGTALGIMNGDEGVPTLEFVGPLVKPIDNTDAYGDMEIDGILRGVKVFAQMTCLEYKAGPIAAVWPYGTIGLAGVIGRLAYNVSAALVMTSVTGTPSVATPATLTASKALLAPNFAARLRYGPVLREVPLRFHLYPYLISSAVGFFSQT